MKKKIIIGMVLVLSVLIIKSVFFPLFNLSTMQSGRFNTPRFWAEVIKVYDDKVLFRSHDELEEYGIERG